MNGAKQLLMAYVRMLQRGAKKPGTKRKAGKRALRKHVRKQK